MIAASCYLHCGCVSPPPLYPVLIGRSDLLRVIGSHSSDRSLGTVWVVSLDSAQILAQQFVANFGWRFRPSPITKNVHQNKTTRSKSLGPFRGLMRHGTVSMRQSVSLLFPCRQSVSTPNGRLMIAEMAVFSKLRRLHWKKPLFASPSIAHYAIAQILMELQIISCTAALRNNL